MEPALQALLAATGSFLFMTIIFAVIYALCKDPKKHTRRHHPPRARTAPAAELSSIESATFDPALTRIEIGELARVTRDFSPDLIIGDGSFGLVYRAKLASGVTVAVKKLAPDAFQGLQYIYGCMMATTPGDVYSFGVLMLEIATGRRPNFPFAGGDGYEIRLVEWVTNMVSQKRYMEMIDPNLSRESLPENDVINYFAIATMCVSEDPKVRPTMSDVVGMLE
nr:leucine-rich repeat receptor protein kinase EMS1 [Ipomoea batatas]